MTAKIWLDAATVARKIRLERYRRAARAAKRCIQTERMSAFNRALERFARTGVIIRVER